MRTLTETEKLKVERTIAPLVLNRRVEAVCVYGSQIAGYSREESDYDVIVILSHFSQRIKYYYLKGEVECSALAVNSSTFQSDCSKSSLGEFVAGRLLNPYEALCNARFIRDSEIAYKRRVILEGLGIAYAESGSFAEELEFGLLYFLFEKLRRRAAIYPPVVYSYAQTYGEKLYETNSDRALDAFREAATQLDSEGTIKFLEAEDKVKIKSDKFKRGLGAKLSVTASYTARGLRQYAVHGYAGRVGLDVMGREVASKLTRSKDHVNLPECIDSPKLFWNLSDAKLYPESSDWISDMLDFFGMEKETTKITNKGLGEIYSAAKFFTFQDKERTLSFAAKRYNDVRGMKWGLMNLWALRNTNFTIGALDRLHREFRAIHELRKMGIATPEVLAVFLSERMLVSRFVQGKDLSSVQSEYLNERTTDLSPLAEFGKVLAILHRNGFCMGDSKPSNAIISDQDHRMYLTDLEQAHERGNPVWDIAEFVYYSIRFTLKEDKAKKLISSFVKGYLGAGGSRETVLRSSSFRYRAPFQAFIAPNVLNSVLQVILSK